MEVLLFLSGALLRFCIMTFPNSWKDIVSIIKTFTILGLLLWGIRFLQGRGVAAIFALIGLYFLGKFIFQYRQRMMPFFHEWQIIFWNIILLYLSFVVDIPQRVVLIICLFCIISSAVVLVKKTYTMGSRYVLFCYLTLAFCTVDFLLLRLHPEYFLGFLQSSPLQSIELVAIGFQIWGFVTSCVIFFGRYMLPRTEKEAYNEYDYFGSHFADHQAHPYILISIIALCCLAVIGNGYFSWIPHSEFIGMLMIIGYLFSRFQWVYNIEK